MTYNEFESHLKQLDSRPAGGWQADFSGSITAPRPFDLSYLHVFPWLFLVKESGKDWRPLRHYRSVNLRGIRFAALRWPANSSAAPGFELAEYGIEVRFQTIGTRWEDWIGNEKSELTDEEFSVLWSLVHQQPAKVEATMLTVFKLQVKAPAINALGSVTPRPLDAPISEHSTGLNPTSVAGKTAAASEQNAVEEWTELVAAYKTEREAWDSWCSTLSSYWSRLPVVALGTTEKREAVWKEVVNGACAKVQGAQDKRIIGASSYDGDWMRGLEIKTDIAKESIRQQGYNPDAIGMWMEMLLGKQPVKQEPQAQPVASKPQQIKGEVQTMRIAGKSKARSEQKP